jgi:hypothetical protein
MVVDDVVLFIDGQPAASTVVIERKVVEWSCAVPVNATAQLVVDGVLLEPFLRPGEAIWRWRWQAPAVAGEYEAHITIQSSTERTEWREVVRVVPSLLDAQRYTQLLADLAQLIPTLVHALRGGRQPAGDMEAGRSDVAALLALLTGPATARFIAALERLTRRVVSRRLLLERPRELGDWRERPDPSRWRITTDAMPLPDTRWPDRIQPLTPRYDPSDRSLQVVSLLLDQVIGAAQSLLLSELPADKRMSLIAVLGRLRAIRASIVVSAPVSMSPTSWQPRTRDERIVQVYRRLFRRRLGVGRASDLLSIPVREVARLYEVWCTVQVALCLAQLPGWHIVEQSLMSEDCHLHIEHQHPLLVLVNAGGATVKLRYQPRYAPNGQPFRSLDDRVRVPDMALEITPAQAEPCLMLLDAKYRHEAGELPASALDEGYSYLAGIGDWSGQRVVKALALLFPADNVPKTYSSGLTVLPLLPGESVVFLHTWLEAQLRGVLEDQ